MNHSDPLGYVQDDPSTVEAARLRVSKSPRRFPLLKKKKTTTSLTAPELEQSVDLESLPATNSEPNLHSASSEAPQIELGIPPSQSGNEDVYRWAVVYENQRGIFLFSIPYFSGQSLLPIDPPPFTIPTASVKRSEQPDVSLEHYPLPSGQWNWVSRQWMIDMRSEGGQVQHDGFEYNWAFRRRNWRSEVGKFGAGGFVRRRRWIRLMVLPAALHAGNTMGGSSSPPTVGTPPSLQMTPESSRPASTSGLSFGGELHPDLIWMGNDTAESWRRYQACLSLLPSDGHRLETWCRWLGLPSGYILRHQPIFWSEDEKSSSRISWSPSSSPAMNTTPVGNVLSVLEEHYHEIFQSFIYPQSRADFLKLLTLSGVLIKLNIDIADTIRCIDFWSYTQEEYSIPSQASHHLEREADLHSP